jgi:hypothetical protein
MRRGAHHAAYYVPIRFGLMAIDSKGVGGDGLPTQADGAACSDLEKVGPKESFARVPTAAPAALAGANWNFHRRKSELTILPVLRYISGKKKKV